MKPEIKWEDSVTDFGARMEKLTRNCEDSVRDFSEQDLKNKNKREQRDSGADRKNKQITEIFWIAFR